jgi:hypothetical protein
MPNWCENELTIAGSIEDVDEVLRLVNCPPDSVGMDVYGPWFSFQAIDPMPWRQFNDEAAAVRDEMKRAGVESGTKEAVEWLDKWYGVGADVFRRPVDGFNWKGYDWALDHWGTKWQPSDVDLSPSAPDNEMIDLLHSRGYGEPESTWQYLFTTAWAPPVAVIATLAKRFTRVHFLLYGFEGGMGFETRDVFMNGSWLEDASYEKTYSGGRGG